MGKQNKANLFDLNLPNERKFTYSETSPTVIENTKEVAEHYAHEQFNSKIYHTFSREISPNTKYFRFDSPKMKGYKPLIGSSQSRYFKKYTKDVENYIEYERQRGRFDKSSQKRFAEGIFSTSLSIYLGNLFDTYETPALFTFKPQSWEDFPYQEIKYALENGENRSFIMDNIIDGFKVGTKKGGLSIITRNPELKDIYSKVSGIADPDLRLRFFLEKTSEQGVEFQKAATVCSTEELRESVLNGILDYPQNLYIKPSTTGGGYSVFRINKEKGNLIESDSKEFEKYLTRKKEHGEVLKRMIESCGNRIKALHRYSGPAVIMDHEKNRLERTKKAYTLFMENDDKKTDLSLIFHNLLQYPIVEEEIPFATFSNNGRVYRPEFRVICQNSGNGFGFDTEIYTKVGKSEVSANISLGASALPAEKALEHLYNEAGIPLSSVSGDLEKIIEGSKVIAERQMKAYGEKQNPADKKNPRDLAIDVVPSLNLDKNKLDFYFIEINWQYGFSGLRRTNPEAALRVIDRKGVINKK